MGLMNSDFKHISFSGNYLNNPFEIEDLSFQYSTIPLLIVINVVEDFHANSNLSIKKLFSAFKCSSLTVKKYLDQLISHNYINVVESSSDRRVRYLKPTPALLDLMKIYLSE